MHPIKLPFLPLSLHLLGYGAKDIPHQARVMTDAMTRQQCYVVIWAGRQIHLSPRH